jgi:putative ABC transport system permease protein
VRATASRSQRTTLSAFVVCQVAFALVLSISAGLLVQAFRRVLQVDPGFNPKNLLLFRISLPDLNYDSPQRKIHYYDSLLARLQALPGVNAAAATSSPPLGGHWGGVFESDNAHGSVSSKEKPTVLQIAVTPRYFNTVGMTLLAGRSFNEEDDQPESAMAVIVNESFAGHFWGTESPIGKRIRRPGATDDRGLFNSWFQVVGLVRDERHDGLDQRTTPCVFFPLSKVLFVADPNDGRALRQITIALRSAGAPDTFIQPAHAIVHELDPGIPIYLVETMQQQLDDSLWARRVYSWLFEGFAAVAVLLAIAGVYGVMSYSVSQRTQEYGIRMALGAQRSQVLRDVLVHGFTLVVIGIAIGIANGLWKTNLLRSKLFGVSTHDLFVFSAAVVCIAGAGLFASLRPALRAASVSPLRVLRSN